ncbi:uncharacterized protein LOC129578120 isoform X2 [Sitodiplosis mosellana]|uniref:uncharacterized protein LOC129578120 isoform X2 n=1 Tax=Sitodiplosis mosellana TaxID=263140 RepID=UPI0024451397|nr:uncharacterized protein LOC129578120 isoform X2 [Sitodiplosis mosellana]
MTDNASGNSSNTDSGLQTPTKRPRLEGKNTRQAIIDTMFGEVGKFGGQVSSLKTKSNREDEDYRRLYRLYKTALKALNMLKTECDLEDELQPLPTHAETLLQSTNDNVKAWSQYFYINPSPTKKKGVKTIPSPVTERIGSLLHSIGSFYGLTAEAVCSNKRKQENIDNMKDLLTAAKEAISSLETIADKIEMELKPFMEKNRVIRNENPGTSDQSN